MYYCSRQSAASARLLELQADPGYAAHLNDCWSRVKAHTHAWNLDSMLIKPVQRITKYPLLFEDLLACTTPVHPDYFSIRAAAEGARALALNIDDAKRRKDVITSVIGKSTSTVSLTKDNKGNGSGGRGLLLRRFKKDKSGPLSAGVSPSDPSAPPPEITPFAQTQLKELVQRLETSDKLVRRLGKEILEWLSHSKAAMRAEIDINLRFLKWYTLDGKFGKDLRNVKVIQYKALLEGILATAWEELVSNCVFAPLTCSEQYCVKLGHDHARQAAGRVQEPHDDYRKAQQEVVRLWAVRCPPQREEVDPRQDAAAGSDRLRCDPHAAARRAPCVLGGLHAYH